MDNSITKNVSLFPQNSSFWNNIFIFDTQNHGNHDNYGNRLKSLLKIVFPKI